MPYKRIMAAVDGSETSDNAFIDALNLTLVLKAELCAVHIVDAFPVYNLSMGIDFDRYREIVRNNGLAILDRMQQMAKRHNILIETKLIEVIDCKKRISENLIEILQIYQADLLILGTHGRRGFHRLILGSVAEETMRDASIPVLLIRAEEGTVAYHLQRRDIIYKRIIVAVDGSETAFLALTQAIYLSKALQANLCILHVVNESAKDPNFAKHPDQMQNECRRHGNEVLDKAKEHCMIDDIQAETLMVEMINQSGSIAGEIIAACEAYKANLLVIGTHGRKGLNRILLGSIAEEAVRIANIPVLLVRKSDFQ